MPARARELSGSEKKTAGEFENLVQIGMLTRTN